MKNLHHHFAYWKDNNNVQTHKDFTGAPPPTQSPRVCSRVLGKGDDEVGVSGRGGFSGRVFHASHRLSVSYHGVGGAGLRGRAVCVRHYGVRLPNHGDDDEGVQHDQRE